MQMSHGIHSGSAGIEDFLGCSRSPGTGSFQQFIQVLLRVLTSENYIAQLLDIAIISIQIHRGARADIHRIAELDAVILSSRKRYHITASSGTDTPQAIGSIANLCILLEEYRIIILDTQIARSINRAAGGSLVSAKLHTIVPIQHYRAVAIPINRTTRGSIVPAEHHAFVPIQYYRAVTSPINRAAGGSLVSAERHTLIVTQRDVPPINRAAIGVGGACRHIPAERHTSIVTQRDGAVLEPINRAAIGGGFRARRRIPTERHTSIVIQRDGAKRGPINRAAEGLA